MMSSTDAIPVIVIAGYLGSGKTTTLNNILHESSPDRRIAVLLNEFAVEFGLNNELQRDNTGAVIDSVFEFGGGCVCCSSADDLMERIEQLTTAEHAPTHIVIETTGRADPAPIAQMIRKNSRIYLSAVITVVDAERFVTSAAQFSADNSAQYKNEVINGVVFADRIIINKIDLIDSASLDRLIHAVRALNADAEVACVQRGRVDIDFVFKPANSTNIAADTVTALSTSRGHDPSIQSVVLTSTAPVDPSAVVKRLIDFVRRRADTDHIDRVKGVLFDAAGNKFVLQGVAQRMDLRSVQRNSDEETVSLIVLIGKNVAQLEGDTSIFISTDGTRF